MKYTKAASVLAVSMVAVGAASSVAAAQGGTGVPSSSPSMSLNSGLQQVVDAYNTNTKLLDGPVPLVDSAKDAAKKLNDARNAEPMKLVEGAVKPAGSMLGGLPVGR
ncbi:hypothetical protein [Streptomyces sp. NPDC054863]